jgi:hypothetical protein
MVALEAAIRLAFWWLISRVIARICTMLMLMMIAAGEALISKDFFTP